MVSVFFLYCILLLPCIVKSAPLTQNDASDYEYYEGADAVENFVEKDSCTILVRIDSPPSTFFSLLPNYLIEVSTAINRSTTVARINNQDQIFVGMNESRRIITEEEASSSVDTFVEVLLETDLFECFNEDHLIQSINSARQTFSSITIIDFLVADPAPSLSPSAEFLIGVGCCLAIIIIMLIVIVQKRRAPKKRTHTENAMTVIPDYNNMPDAITLQYINVPQSAGPAPPPQSFLPPPVFTAHPVPRGHTVLHRQASGAGPVVITESKRWMVNVRDEQGCTPLHCLAAAPCDKKVPSQVEADAHCLIENGANVNEQDSNGNTPLHLSVSNIRPSLAKILIDTENIDVTIVNREEQTPLHIAASLDDFIVLDLLLSAPNIKETLNMTDFRNYTPLVVNVRNASTDVNFVRKLLLAGADPNYPGDEVYDHDRDDQFNRERTALHYAAQLGMNEHVKILTEHGANVNAHDSRRRSPLHYAVENCKMSTIQLLVAIGGETGIHDHNDQTPVDLAKAMGFQEAIEFFAMEAARKKEPVNKRKRRGGKDDKEKKRRRSSTETGYHSSSPIRNLEDDEGEIVATPTRSVQPNPNQLFPHQLPHNNHPIQYHLIQDPQPQFIDAQYAYANVQYVQNEQYFYDPQQSFPPQNQQHYDDQFF